MPLFEDGDIFCCYMQRTQGNLLVYSRIIHPIHVRLITSARTTALQLSQGQDEAAKCRRIISDRQARANASLIAYPVHSFAFQSKTLFVRRMCKHRNSEKHYPQFVILDACRSLLEVTALQNPPMVAQTFCYCVPIPRFLWYFFFRHIISRPGSHFARVIIWFCKNSICYGHFMHTFFYH